MEIPLILFSLFSETNFNVERNNKCGVSIMTQTLLKFYKFILENVVNEKSYYLLLCVIRQVI